MANQYYLDALEPAVFQRLVNALLVLRYGEGVRLLPLRGKDGGRDAETPPGSSYFTVSIPPSRDGIDPGPIKPGRYLFQAKHHRALWQNSWVEEGTTDEASGRKITKAIVGPAARGNAASASGFPASRLPRGMNLAIRHKNS
jgi:hypothetical protein